MARKERKIIEIDRDKCNGCGVCVDACHEGAIQMVEGKAKLVSDIYCDGLGDCLGPCPVGAITIVTRPAEDYDPAAVEQRMRERSGLGQGGCPGMAAHSLKAPAAPVGGTLPCGCPGSASQTLKKAAAPCACDCEDQATPAMSELVNWPVQLKLVPPAAPYLKGADLLLAADCTAFAVPDIHARYMRNRPVIIACPKLDDTEAQIDKLESLLQTARPASLTVLRMEVPCCGGLVRVAEEAVRRSGLSIPVQAIVVGVDGAEQAAKIA